MKTYSELSSIRSFSERFNYLKLSGSVGVDTFGWSRYLNQELYSSTKWRNLRRDIIIRDDGNDMGLDGYPIFGRIVVHHLNPITPEDIELEKSVVFDPENLVCVSFDTHEAIHYGSDALLPKDYAPRVPGDTKLW